MTTISPANISGAMLWMRKAVMLLPLRSRASLYVPPERRCAPLPPGGERLGTARRRSCFLPPRLEDLLSQQFFSALLVQLLGRIGNQPLKERDALDELGDALQCEEQEPDRHH